MKKLLILIAFTLLLSSCFGGEEVTIETPQVENTVIEETLAPVETLIIDDTETTTEDSVDTENVKEAEASENTSEATSSPVRESVPVEKVEIKDPAAENDDYDVRANIENDSEATVVTEETFVVPTAPRAQEVQVEEASKAEAELTEEEKQVSEELLWDLLEGIADSLEILEENE